MVALTLLLSACGCSKAPGQQSSTTEKAPAVSPAENGGVISSIKDAMGLGKKMECTYKNNINGQEFTAVTQVDGKNFKSISEVNGKKIYTVMKDGSIYSWGEGIPMATKLDLACIQDLQKNIPQGQPPIASDQDPQKSFDNATNVSCQPSEAVDVSVPSDIQFQDTCEMMKGVTEKMKNIKIPTGANIPNLPNLPATK